MNTGEKIIALLAKSGATQTKLAEAAVAAFFGIPVEHFGEKLSQTGDHEVHEDPAPYGAQDPQLAAALTPPGHPAARSRHYQG